MPLALRTAVRLADLTAWLSHMGYPLPAPGASLLVWLEGALPTPTPESGITRSGGRWGVHGDLWEARSGADAITVAAEDNTVDELDDTGLLLWRTPDHALHFAALLGTCNTGSRLARKSGWPQLGDGLHHYAQSTRSDGRLCLRSDNNRAFRELPTRPGTGGDGHLTLPEVIARGMGHNGSLLIHPGDKATWSAGCSMTSGGYDDPSWRGVYGNSAGGCGQVLHPGHDLLRWVAEGRRQTRPPVLRPGSNAARWVRAMQQKVGASADGVYGPGTAAALLANRTAAGLLGEARIRSDVHDGDWMRWGVL